MNNKELGVKVSLEVLNQRFNDELNKSINNFGSFHTKVERFGGMLAQNTKEANEQLASLFNVDEKNLAEKFAEVSKNIRSMSVGANIAEKDVSRAMEMMEKHTEQLSAELIEAEKNLKHLSSQKVSNASSIKKAKENVVDLTRQLKLAEKELNKLNKAKVIDTDAIELAKIKFDSLTDEVKDADIALAKLRSSEAINTRDIKEAEQSVTELKRELEKASIASKQFESATTTAMNRADVSAHRAKNAIYDMFNIKTDSQIKAEIAQINAELIEFQKNSGKPATEIKRVTRQAEKQIKSLRQELLGLDNATNNISSLRNKLIGFGATYLGIQEVANGIRAVVDNAKKLDSLNQKLEYATGSAEKAAQKYDELRESANRLGLEQVDLANGYAKLAAAGNEIGLTSEEIQTTFDGVANAAAGMSLTADEANSVFLAMSQIAGKGKVSMEELRQQLGERLTPAMGIAAKSMGVTVAELDKLVSSGNLASKDFLPQFGAALTEAFSDQASKNIDTMTGKVNRLKNQMTDFLDKLNDGLVGDGISSGLDLLSEALEKIDTAIDELDPATVDAVREAFSQFTNLVGTGITEVLGVIGDLSDYFGVLFSFTDTSETQAKKVGLLTRSIQGISVVLGILSDGVSAIAIGFKLALGAGLAFYSGISLALSKLTFGDLSEKLENFSIRLSKASKESFADAKQSALDFKSTTKEALESVSNDGKASLQKLADEAKAIFKEMSKTIGVSTEELKKQWLDYADKSIQANDNVISKQLESEAKTFGMSDALQKVAEKHSIVAKKAEEVTRIYSEMPELIAQYTLEAQKQIDATGGVVTETIKADAAMRGLVVTVDEYGRAVVKSMNKSKEATKQATEEAKLDINELNKELGIGLSDAYTKSKDKLGDLVDGFDDLKEQGIDASDLVSRSIQNMLDKAKNPEELNDLISMWEDLGQQGKITTDDIVAGLDLTNAKLSEMTSETEKAYKALGLVSQEAAQRTAKEYREAFETIKADGNATKEQLSQAFQKVAESAISANKGMIDYNVQTEASLYNVKVEADETGKVIVSRMNDASDATANVKNATDYASDGYQTMADSAETASERSINAIESEIDAIERKNKALSDARGAQVNDARGLGGVGIKAYSEDDVKQQLKNLGIDDKDIERKAKKIFEGFKSEERFKPIGGESLSNAFYVQEELKKIAEQLERQKKFEQIKKDDAEKQIKLNKKIEVAKQQKNQEIKAFKRNEKPDYSAYEKQGYEFAKKRLLPPAPRPVSHSNISNNSETKNINATINISQDGKVTNVNSPDMSNLVEKMVEELERSKMLTGRY